MPSFRKAKRQADYVIKKNQQLGHARHANKASNKIHSLGTKRNYEQSLTRIAEWTKAHRLGHLQQLTEQQAIIYLQHRGQSVKQKTLDQERQAMQMLLQHKLPVVKSELTQTLASRAYTSEQVKIIQQAQTAKYQLATKIALVTGLRAHELLTLRRSQLQPASTHRQWSEQRFVGLEGVRYTVVGKGGLIREVLIPNELSVQLEARRLTYPQRVTDREIYYQQYYDLGGGKAWSNSFSAASKRTLSWSHGAHGLRHSFAQQCMNQLQQLGFLYHDALGMVSQLMGHFRPDITEVYLR